MWVAVALAERPQSLTRLSPGPAPQSTRLPRLSALALLYPQDGGEQGAGHPLSLEIPGRWIGRRRNGQTARGAASSQDEQKSRTRDVDPAPPPAPADPAFLTPSPSVCERDMGGLCFSRGHLF